MKKDFISAIAVILLFIALTFLGIELFQKWSNKGNNVRYDTITKQIYLPSDTVFKTRTITQPHLIRDTIKLPPDTIRVDTAWIVKDYFREKLYIDTTKFDTSAIVVTKAFISWNDLDSLNVSYKWLRPTTIILPQKIIETKYTIYAQMQLGFGADKFALPLGVTCAKKKNLFGADYDFINKMVYLRYGIKIYAK
jgi:hypothetical protein